MDEENRETEEVDWAESEKVASGGFPNQDKYVARIRYHLIYFALRHIRPFHGVYFDIRIDWDSQFFSREEVMSILTPYPRKSDKPETPKYRNLRNTYQIFAV